MCLDDLSITRRDALAMGAASLALPLLRRRRTSRPLDAHRPLIRTRDEWGADLPPVGPLYVETDVRFLLVHHTAGRTNYSEAAVVDQMREVYRYHTGPEKGWADVCYNFFIDRFGGIWEGRLGSASGPIVADATGGSQGFAQLVCLLGNFHEHSPTPQMIESLEVLLAHLARRYALDTTPGARATFVSRGSNKWPAGATVTANIISGHRDMSATVCPGDYVYPLLSTSVSDRVNVLSGGPIEALATSTTGPSVMPLSSEVEVTTMGPTTAGPTTVSPTTAEATTVAVGSTVQVAAPTSSSDGPTAPQRRDDGDTTTTLAAAVAAGGAAIAVGALVATLRQRKRTDSPTRDDGEGP